MTFYHFGNCMALAYLPYYLTYKHSGLSEYGAFWKCVYTGMIYALTQLCKMLVLATFFPVPGTQQHRETLTIDPFQDLKNPIALEFFKASIDLADLIGMYIALSRIPGRGHSKCLTAGIGWGIAELFLSRFLTIWVGAKGIEFNWRYIQMSFDANICMVQHIMTSALVWLWSRHDLKPSFYPVVAILSIFGVYKSFFVDLLSYITYVDPWSALIVKAIITVFLGVLAIRVYSTVA